MLHCYFNVIKKSNYFNAQVSSFMRYVHFLDTYCKKCTTRVSRISVTHYSFHSKAKHSSNRIRFEIGNIASMIGIAQTKVAGSITGDSELVKCLALVTARYTECFIARIYLFSVQINDH